jgi:hypothetical protein
MVAEDGVVFGDGDGLAFGGVVVPDALVAEGVGEGGGGEVWERASHHAGGD